MLALRWADHTVNPDASPAAWMVALVVFLGLACLYLLVSDRVGKARPRHRLSDVERDTTVIRPPLWLRLRRWLRGGAR